MQQKECEFEKVPATKIAIKRRKLAQGVGINDALFMTSKLVNGVKIKYKPYQIWASILTRCFSESRGKSAMSYVGCTIADDWISFSNFDKWYSSQDYEGKEVDKDLLFPLNREYGPEKCILVSKEVNMFAAGHDTKKRDTPIGVSHYKENNTYRIKCRIGSGVIIEACGFKNATDAFNAWKIVKQGYAEELAYKPENENVKDVLLSYVERRYGALNC